MPDQKQSQLDKFNEAESKLVTDDNEQRFNERLRKLVKVKPKPEKPE